MRRRTVLCGLLHCGVLLGGSAMAGYPPVVTLLPETTTADFVIGVVPHPMHGATFPCVRILDHAQGDAVIAEPGATPLIWWNNGSYPCKITVSPFRVDNGIDFVCTVENPSNVDWVDLPRINLPNFLPGQSIRQRSAQNSNVNKICSLSAVHTPNSTTQVNLGTPYYPGDLYAPIAVFGDDSYTIGVSVQYPVVTYNHGFRINMSSDLAPSHTTNVGWNVIVEGTSSAYASSEIAPRVPPGKTYSYVVSVRVLRQAVGSSDEALDKRWLEVLLPYRDYFQSLYGGPRYHRDPRLVRGVITASVENMGYTNLRGFSVDRRLDTDPDGYGMLVTELEPRLQASNGYKRAMLWSISGLYHPLGLTIPTDPNQPQVPFPPLDERQESPCNYPFNFYTGMSGVSNLSNSAYKLGWITGENREIGYWWGNCTRVMSGWDQCDQSQPLDPSNAADRAAAYAELDGAVYELGATSIGLDAYGYELPSPRDKYKWLQRLQARAPHVRFVTETLAPDFLHTLAPSFIDAGYVDRANSLADFLIPGQETWLQEGIPQGNASQQEADEYAAARGYVVIENVDIPVTPSMTAAEGWNSDYSVPASLRQPIKSFRNALQLNPADIASLDGSPIPDGQLTVEDLILFMNGVDSGCTGAVSRSCNPSDIADVDGEPNPDGVIENGDYELFFYWYELGGSDRPQFPPPPLE